VSWNQGTGSALLGMGRTTVSYVPSPMNCETMGRFYSVRSCNIGCYYRYERNAILVGHIANHCGNPFSGAENNLRKTSNKHYPKWVLLKDWEREKQFKYFSSLSLSRDSRILYGNTDRTKLLARKFMKAPHRFALQNLVAQQRFTRVLSIGPNLVE